MKPAELNKNDRKPRKLPGRTGIRRKPTKSVQIHQKVPGERSGCHELLVAANGPHEACQRVRNA